MQVANGAVLRELEFTKAVAELGMRDSALAVSLARALLHQVRSGPDDRTATRAARLLRVLPRKHLQIVSEKSSPNERLLDLYRRVFHSKYDWLFEGENLALAVEVKISTRTPFNEYQLSSHHRALTDRGSDFAGKRLGLLALTPSPPRPSDLISVRGHRAFLGSVLWPDVLPALRKIPSASPAAAERWQQLLAVVS
jgi:hypothetical protein